MFVAVNHQDHPLPEQPMLFNTPEEFSQDDDLLFLAYYRIERRQLQLSAEEEDVTKPPCYSHARLLFFQRSHGVHLAKFNSLLPDAP